MKKGNLRLIPLQADLCLNKQKVDIEDFKGWQDCNAPVYGDCLSPLYKKENEHHDIFIGEDKYDFENGVLYKNDTPVLSGVGSKKLVKTKINDNYSSMKITENNFLSWCKESGSNSVIVRLGETEETEITISNCSRIVSTKCFGDSQAGIYGCIVWYMHTSGSYGYYIVWDAESTRHTSYGESSPTLFSNWEVVAPLIQVAIPSTNMVLISLFGNSGVNIPKTEVKNIAIYNNTVYDNPSFVDATSYPTRYNTIVERLGVHINIDYKLGTMTGRDYDSLNDYQPGQPRVSCQYYWQQITVMLTTPSTTPITVTFYYYKSDNTMTATGRSIVIPAGSTRVSVSNQIFGAYREIIGGSKSTIGQLLWRDGVQVQSFTAADTFLPPQIDKDDGYFTIVARLDYINVTEQNNPLVPGETISDYHRVDGESKNGYYTMSGKNNKQSTQTSFLRYQNTETITDIYGRFMNSFNAKTSPYSTSEAYPVNWRYDWSSPSWILYGFDDVSGNTKYFNTSGNAYSYFSRAYKEEYIEQALKNCDCVLDDNRLYCVNAITNDYENPLPTKLFSLVGNYQSFNPTTRVIDYQTLAKFDLSYQEDDSNIYPKYWAGISVSLQDKYLRVLYKFKKNKDTNEIIYFGVDSSSIRESLGKNIILYPGVQQGTDGNNQGGCLNKSGWRLLFNNNMLSNVACYEDENYIGTILADWLSIDTDFHTTFNTSKLYYRDNSNVIWCIEKVDSGEEWSYRFIENRYIVLNTTNYFNCYDTQTGLKRHWASDYNNRVMFGFAFNQYAVNDTFTNLLQTELYRGLIVSGQNANYERTKDTITSIELGAIRYERCLKDYITFISCNTPYGAIEGIDMYRGDGGSTSAAYICSFKNGMKYIDTDLTNPFAIYPISQNGDVRYNPNLFTRFISSYNNKDMVISDGIAYKIVYFNNVIPIMAYYLLDGVESLEDAFVLQSSYYGVSKTRLYQMNYSNGVGVEVVCDITNMEYLGALPTQALFWSAQNRAVYAFTGSCIMQLRQYANELEQIYGKWYNPATQELFLDTNIGLLVFSDLGTYCLKDFHDKRIKDIFFFPDYFIINLWETPTELVPVIYSHYYSYNKKTGYESNRVLFLTKYYGNAHTPITVNNVYLRIYNQAESDAEGYVKMKGHTFTDIGTQTDQRTVAVGGPGQTEREQWDAETGTMLIKYTPQFNRGLGFALEVDSTFPIIDIKFDYVEDGGVESQIAHVNI